MPRPTLVWLESSVCPPDARVQEGRFVVPHGEHDQSHHLVRCCSHPHLARDAEKALSSARVSNKSLWTTQTWGDKSPLRCVSAEPGTWHCLGSAESWTTAARKCRRLGLRLCSRQELRRGFCCHGLRADADGLCAGDFGSSMSQEVWTSTVEEDIDDLCVCKSRCVDGGFYDTGRQSAACSAWHQPPENLRSILYAFHADASLSDFGRTVAGAKCEYMSIQTNADFVDQTVLPHFSAAQRRGCAVAWLGIALACAHKAYFIDMDWRRSRLHLFEAERLLALVAPCLDRAVGYAGWPTWKVAHQPLKEAWPLSVAEVLWNVNVMIRRFSACEAAPFAQWSPNSLEQKSCPDNTLPWWNRAPLHPLQWPRWLQAVNASSELRVREKALKLPDDIIVTQHLRIACLLPAVLPVDADMVQAQVDTFLQECDWMKVFVAKPPETLLEQSSFDAFKSRRSSFFHAEIVDLAEYFPGIALDPTLEETFKAADWAQSGFGHMERVAGGNLGHKVLHTLLYIATEGALLSSAEWFCMMDVDTALIVPNLRRLIQENTHMGDADLAYFVGRENFFWRGLNVGAVIFPDLGPGVCMTRGAVRRFGKHLQNFALFVADPLWRKYRVANRDGLWGFNTQLPQSLANFGPGCHFIQGHYADVLLGYCFRLLDVRLHPMLGDECGRSYFTNSLPPCDELLLMDGRLSSQDASDRAEDDLNVAMDRRQQLQRVLETGWGKAHLLHEWMLCEPAVEPNFWLHPYAVGFHGLKSSKLIRRAHEIFIGLQMFPQQCRLPLQVAKRYEARKEH